MSEQTAFSHRGCVLTIKSHEVPKGGWVATVAIEQLVDGKTYPYLYLGLDVFLSDTGRGSRRGQATSHHVD